MVATKPLEAAQPSKKLITAEEFLELPKSLNKPELVDGEVVEMSPVGMPHGVVQLALGALMQAHVKREKQGKVMSEVGFILTRNPDTVRAPDISFVSAAQLRERPRSEGYYEGYPDLAVEVISPGDRMRDVEEKLQQYFDAGTRLVWLVRPEARVVMMRYPNGRGQILRGEDVLSGEDVLPGFEIKLTDLFDE